MFSRSARLYDGLYSFKDYEAEVIEIRDLIRARKSDAASVLDVACGTGMHLAELSRFFEAEGLDLDPTLLEVARKRVPDVPLHEGDMRTFDLGKTFDAVTCLFSSIGYVRSKEELGAAFARMAAHLHPGGVLIVEGWFSRAEWDDGHIGSLFVDQPELKIARMNLSTTRDDFSVMEFHYLVAEPHGIEHFTEFHELRLFEREDYVAAMEAAGLRAERDDDALMGRGVYIGVKG
jgi:SAM-dependent methyltransferase